MPPYAIEICPTCHAELAMGDGCPSCEGARIDALVEEERVALEFGVDLSRHAMARPEPDWDAIGI
jgi:hypothetical protein